MTKTSTRFQGLEELRSELAHTRLGHEIFESVEANFSGDHSQPPGCSRLAAFVADLITDLYDADSSNDQNRLRLTTNLEMAADRLTALASQLRSSSPRHGAHGEIATPHNSALGKS